MSRRSLAALEKRLRKLESRRNADIGIVPVTDVVSWGAEDRQAFLDTEGDWPAQRALVERVTGRPLVVHANPGDRANVIVVCPHPGAERESDSSGDAHGRRGERERRYRLEPARLREVGE